MGPSTSDQRPQASGHHQRFGAAPDEQPTLLSISSAGAGSEPEAIFIASFAEFYRLHHPKIAKSLALNFGDVELGLEAADEAMTRAYSHWGTVSGHNNPAGWVYRVGLNWGRSWFRRAGRRLPWIERTATEMPETTDPSLRDAMLALDQKHRAVVICRYYLDWSTKQTAAALELPTGTVKSRLHQALNELREQLAETEPDPDRHSLTDSQYPAPQAPISARDQATAPGRDANGL